MRTAHPRSTTFLQNMTTFNLGRWKNTSSQDRTNSTNGFMNMNYNFLKKINQKQILKIHIFIYVFQIEVFELQIDVYELKSNVFKLQTDVFELQINI